MGVLRWIANKIANTIVTIIPKTSKELKMMMKGSDQCRNSTVLFKHVSLCGDEYSYVLQFLHFSPVEVNKKMQI